MVAGVSLGGAAVAAPTEVQRGAYLFRAADCAACHSAPGGEALTGGRGFALPFGTVHATNITPDRETGIGAYDDAAWLRVLRTGVARGGKRLYPVMPYPAYTLMSDADALAIRAYLLTLKPVRAEAVPNDLGFPFNQRWTMVFWNMLNNPDRRMTPRADRSAQWNRGAYLAEALGHCSQCHTPRTITYGLSGRAYAGAVQVGWRAYNLTSDREHGLGGWSDADLAQYLSTGRAVGHGPASGPMAEAVEDSLRYLTPEDIAAIVVYMRSVPARAEGPAVASGVLGDVSAGDLGGRVFAQVCAGCHLPDGRGRQSGWAALAGAHSVADPEGVNLVQVLRSGTALKTDQGEMFMHGFTGAYTAPELAALSDYVLARFGGVRGRVTEGAFGGK